LEAIAVLHNDNHDSVIQACVLYSLRFIKVNVLAPSSVYFSTTVTYISSCSFMHLRGFSLLLRCMLKSSASHVRVKTFTTHTRELNHDPRASTQLVLSANPLMGRNY